MTMPVTRITDEAVTLTTNDPHAPLDDLAPLRPVLDQARIVGIGDPVRGARELLRTGHRLLRLMVEELGFRVLAVETPYEGGARVDAHIRTGAGTAEAAVGELWAPWQIAEFADVVRWLRDFNAEHPEDPVTFAGIDGPLDDIASADRQFHDNLMRLLEDTGQRIAYWGGTAHATAAAPTHFPAMPTPRTSAGSRLRGGLGADYVAVGLTFHHGQGRGLHVPSPSPKAVEAALDQAGAGPYAVDLRHARHPDLRQWSQAAMATRVIGPAYTPESDEQYLMTGGSVAESFDVLLHHPEVSGALPLK